MASSASSAARSSQCRSLTAHVECVRRSSRGRPQRGSQGREAARTSSTRFGSRGSSGGPRSRSGTRCRRPSAEVELRSELGTSIATFEPPTIVNECASGFVCDLIHDAVDDFVDDLIHDVDDGSFYAEAMMTPIQGFPTSDAHLVLSTGEPCIFEEVEEDEDICLVAELLTARAAEEAVAVLAPGSPSWSMQVNAPCEDVAVRKLDLGEVDDEETEETCSSCDEYEEVYSLASDSEQETDNEMETMAYVQMAVSLAKKAVFRGCAAVASEDAVLVPKEEQDETAFNEWFFNEQISPMEQQGPAYVPRLQNNYVMGWSKVDVVQEAEFDVEEAKAAARHALRNALLGGEVLHDVDEDEKEEKFVDFIGEEGPSSDELAFDFASDILDNAFFQASVTWQQQAEAEEDKDEDEDLEDLRLQARSTLTKAAFTGELDVALRRASQEPSMETLKARARETLLNSSFAQNEFEIESLKGKAREALFQVASQDKDEDAELEDLRLQAMSTLSKAAFNGELEAALRKVPQQPCIETLKARARTCLLNAAANRQPEIESLKAKAREALLQAATQRRQPERKAEPERRVMMLREKAKATLDEGARSGQLIAALKGAVEAAKMKDLKAKLRSTLLKATEEGKLTSTLNSVAPRYTADQIKKNQQDEDLRSKVLNTLKQGVAAGTLGPAVEEVLASRKKAEPMPAPSPSRSESVKEPSTPTRSRRRVIGGVVRTPALQLDLDMPSASPTGSLWSDSGSMRKRHSKSSRKPVEAPTAFRLDLGDKSDVEESTRSRASSITRGYEALGVPFHSLSDSPSASSAPKMMLQHPKFEAFERQASSFFDRPASKASARLRAASTSAMAMDLGGGEGASSSYAPFDAGADRLAAFRFAPKSLSLDQKMRPSASLGSLQTPKVTKGRLLPTLDSERKSAESIAWTMNMSKSTSKWCNTGLRGSASMVF